jgi:mTERF
LGLTKRDFAKLAASRRHLFLLCVPTIRTKLKFLQEEVGLSNEELRKLLVKFPRIMEYKTERTLRPHFQFFEKYGLTRDQLAKVCPTQFLE